MSTFVCPNCGEDVPERALACPECGSDKDTGWSDDTYLDGISIPAEDDNEFYNDDSSRTFPLVVGIVLVILFLITLLNL